MHILNTAINPKPQRFILGRERYSCSSRPDPANLLRDERECRNKNSRNSTSKRLRFQRIHHQVAVIFARCPNPFQVLLFIGQPMAEGGVNETRVQRPNYKPVPLTWPFIVALFLYACGLVAVLE